MRVGAYEFRPALWPTLAAAAVLALLVHLGLWQMSRAAEKQALQDRFDALAREPAVTLPAAPVRAEDYEFRRVEAQGTFLPEHMILLDNRIHRGEVGYEVVMPLRLGAGNMHVLVDRGWAPAGARRDQLPAIRTPESQVRVTGIAVVPSTRILELSAHTVEGKVWENLVLERYRGAHPIPLQPFVIEQTSDAADGLVREWERPDTGVTKHQARAFTWFALAVTILVIWVGLNVGRSGQARQD
jgi:surfeit locus 1 family protein